MKYILPFLFMFFSSALASESYLKIESYPSYPLPGENTSQTVKMEFRPSFPEDKQFEEINILLVKISNLTPLHTIALHVGFVSIELSWKGNKREAIYSNTNVKGNQELEKHWQKLFKLLQEISNKQLQL